MALCMSVAMLSLAGIPITSGFFASTFVFSAMIGTGYKWLLILAVLTSAVGAYYYLKVIIAMYFKNQETEESIEIKPSNSFVIVIASIVIIAIGVVPGLIADMFKF
ncbi:MAG: hypothetical protein IPM51_15485 [Sphingobacteriaceae bacterium]|nr:hypothetical protein [Sphingobacteriaceae bacterium]